ncbi:MAG: hypothetical protein GY788_29715 [bacterium]|nr:hypothetical protein [bacterium]
MTDQQSTEKHPEVVLQLVAELRALANSLETAGVNSTRQSPGMSNRDRAELAFMLTALVALVLGGLLIGAWWMRGIAADESVGQAEAVVLWTLGGTLVVSVGVLLVSIARRQAMSRRNSMAMANMARLREFEDRATNLESQVARLTLLPRLFPATTHIDDPLAGPTWSSAKELLTIISQQEHHAPLGVQSPRGEEEAVSRSFISWICGQRR